MESKNNYRINEILDAAFVRPTDTKRDTIKLCKNALKYKFNVCVPPCYVKLAKKILKNKTKLIAVIGFPFGNTATESKVFETKEAIKNGADEIDMVMNIAMFKSKDYICVFRDIKAVKKAAQKKVVKVIIETGYLSKREIVKAAKIAMRAGADFVKTSTGLISGAKIEDIRLIKKVVKDKIGIKASGGIRTKRKALAMIKAGATRIGTRRWEIIK